MCDRAQPQHVTPGPITLRNSQKPDLVFEFRYRPTAVLQALGVIPLLKREAPFVIDLEDEDVQPPPKRRKTTDGEGLVHSMQVRHS